LSLSVRDYKIKLIGADFILRLLHLCSYYTGNKLYKNLFSKLSKKGFFQSVYIPIKNPDLLNRNYFETHGLKFHYDFILKKYDRYLYKGKIKKQMRRVLEKVDTLQTTDIIHAHTLFSDGGTAYLLKKKFGKNYIISVRSTDINTFYKYAVQYRTFSHKVLVNASSIVFISHAYKKNFFELLPKSIVKSIEGKSYVIPNGIDEKWFSTKLPLVKKKEDFTKLNLLFTGSLIKRKNLITVLNLIESLSRDGLDVYLNIAGDGPLRERLITQVNQLGLDEKVVFHGNVSKEELIRLADNSDVFILPSYKETFGISYIEALSRGLPIIYTRNDGIDGYFSEGSVGYSTDPRNLDEMKDKIKNIIINYDSISKNCINEAKTFNWGDIATIYEKLYKNAANEKS